MESIRALFFEPTLRRASVRSIGRSPLAPAAVRVRIEAVLLSRSVWPGAGDVRVPGGAFAGTVIEADDESGHPVGTRVVGIAREGACATETTAGAAVFALRDSISFDDAVIAVTPGISASCAVGQLKEWGAHEVLVTGASGLTGSLVAGLASATGIVCRGITTSPTRAADAARCGFTSIESPEELERSSDWDSLDAVVDCALGTSLPELAYRRIADLPWIAFAHGRGVAESGLVPASAHVVDAVTVASHDICEAVEHFRAVALPLGTGGLHLARTALSLAEIREIWPPDHFTSPGALILRPNGF